MHLYQSRLKDQIIHSVDGVSVHAEGGVYTDAISGMFNVDDFDEEDEFDEDDE